MIAPRLQSALAIASLACALVSASPSSAWGQPAGGKDAQARYDSAIALYDKKDFEGALAGFKEAYAGSKSPNARLFIARCLRELGRTAEAYDEMKATLDEAKARAEKEKRYAETRDAVARELADLERSIAFVTIVVEGGGDDLEVRIGSEVVKREQLGQPLVRAPGRFTVKATSKGKKTIERQMDFVGGQRQTIALAFGEGADAEVAKVSTSTVGPPPPSDKGEPAKGNMPLLASGIAIAALGVGGGVAFAVTGSMAKSKFDEVESGCGGVRCTDPSYADTISSGRTLSTVANVSLGLGIAFAVGGAVMIGIGFPRGGGSKTATASNWSVAVSPTGAGWSLRF